jgi:hypothetical protein
MSQLDARLGTLLEDRKRKNRFRSLKEYDSSHSGLIDFVSIVHPCTSDACTSDACTSDPFTHTRRGMIW